MSTAFRGSLVLLGLFLVPLCTWAEPPAGDPAVRAAIALYDGIRAETLPNGLRVYLKPIPSSPVVTTMVAYQVGSGDEDLDHTGLSHYLEHLMFKGTDKLMPGDIDRLTLRNGGHNNAYTSEDSTVFHFDFAADRWQTALEIEADRMRNLRIDSKHEFEQEKGAVCSEIDQALDEDWEREANTILPLLFGDGPYGHPILGERPHVRAATAPVIKAHYDRWYHPNNAALIVVGGFDTDEALARIKQLFGPIPRADLPPRRLASERITAGPVRKEIEGRSESAQLLMGFNSVRTGDPDYYVLEVIEALLSGGKTSRLYQTLVEGREVAQSAAALNNTGRYPGWFAIQVQLLQEQERGEVEDLVLAELKRLAEKPVETAELQRVQRIMLADEVFEHESVHDLADRIAGGVVTNDLEFLRTYLPRVLAVSPADIQRVAGKYLDPDKRVVVWSVPKEKKAGARLALPQRRLAGLTSPARPIAARQAPPSSGEPFSLGDAKRVVLHNGLTLLLFENRRLPIVVAQAHVRHLTMHEPPKQAGVAALTGYLLGEGTDRHTGPQVAQRIEDAGGLLHFSASGGQVKVLSSDRRLGLGLLLECLAQANFPREAFLRQKDQLLADIEESHRRANTQAEEVFRSRVYEPHPLARPLLGTERTVSALTRRQVQNFHQRLFVPNNTVLAIVGDFDSKEIVEEIKLLTMDWKAAAVKEPRPATIGKPPQFTEQIVPVADSNQIHFYLGHVGVPRNSPDYYKLLVMDYVLGQGPGFTDRLSARLRDREGLAYTVSASITSSAAEEPGTFACYIGTEAKNFTRVKAIFLEELHRIRKEPPTTVEVEDAKKFLLGNLPFGFATSEQVASQLLAVERFRLGFGFLDDYRRAVAAVTAADVHEVAQKYIDPLRMVLVVAGPLDDKGQPLPTAKGRD